MHTPPIKRNANSTINEMVYHTPRTPQPSISFSKELRQALQERNLLTAKSRNKVCAMLNNSSASSTYGTPIGGEADKRKNFRMQAIQEIITSEKTYLNQLETLIQYFVRPLQSIIDASSHSILFSHIEMIHSLNGELLSQLENDVKNVAHAFLKMAPFFKLYSVYAFDYRKALLVSQSLLSKNAAFRKFLEDTESRPEVQRKLNSFMITPIQRVPRYKLLLEQVLLYTSPADEDYKLLKESVKQIEMTVLHINSCVEDQEITQMLINLQNSLLNRSPNIVKPSRKVIKEGILQKVTRNGTDVKRYCVLMSDIFMYCKILKERAPNTVVENSLECCCIFPLKKCKVYELFPGNFKVTCQGDGIIFGTTDLQLGRTWVGFLRDAIDLHVECRKTLRKESSKRTPIRKKDMKKFDMDYVLSPNKKKCDYDSIYRNKNRNSDSDDDSDSKISSTCFPRAKKSIGATDKVKNNTNTKCVAFTESSMPDTQTVEMRSDSQRTSKNPTENRISKLYKYIATEKNPIRGILKRTHTTNATDMTPNTEHDPTYGFASRYSNSKSYFRAHNVDNTIPRAINREDVFGNGNFRDVLYPLRSSGGSNKSAHSANWSMPEHLIQNENFSTPPQKKRVKFDDSEANTPSKPKAYSFTSSSCTNSQQSLPEKIYNFFAKLF
ncbi:kalirin [Teleopsis dalmanni]|uniref:kalirin n=1 Tax=Teleopsis dalmanni TaxID=139649 RepID=UPI0018CDD815|nr:kalirin [Teleopsis dalmanni]